MSDLRATRLNVGTQQSIKVIPSIGSASIRGMTDVDVSNLASGYVLVYDESIQKWKATNLLTSGETQNLIINGGNF